MNWKGLITHSFALLGATSLYFIFSAAMTQDPTALQEYGLTTGRFLWESRVMDIVIQFVAMLAGALGILALTKEAEN